MKQPISALVETARKSKQLRLFGFFFHQHQPALTMSMLPFHLMGSWLADLTGKLPALTHTAPWHACPHCEATTPWRVNALRGEYRCLRCGENPLDGPTV